MVDRRTFVRPIYAGNGMATVAVEPGQKLIMATVSLLLEQHHQGLLKMSVGSSYTAVTAVLWLVSF